MIRHDKALHEDSADTHSDQIDHRRFRLVSRLTSRPGMI